MCSTAEEKPSQNMTLTQLWLMDEQTREKAPSTPATPKPISDTVSNLLKRIMNFGAK